MAAKLDLALGSVLFIDEAYGLGADDPYMRSVVDQLVAETPDRGGADFAVVLGGYVGGTASMSERAWSAR